MIDLKMKRTDMLKIMRAETRNRIDTYELDHLLSIMEESGMLPPREYSAFKSKHTLADHRWDNEEE